MSRWRNAASPLAHHAMPNHCFYELGLVDLEKINTGKVFSVYVGKKLA